MNTRITEQALWTLAELIEQAGCAVDKTRNEREQIISPVAAELMEASAALSALALRLVKLTNAPAWKDGAARELKSVANALMGLAGFNDEEE